MQENQASWNSDNQGIKETVSYPKQPSKRVDRENPWQGGGLSEQSWLKAKLGFRADCGLL